MAIKMLFVDIDGTLYDHDHNHIPPSAILALKEAHRQGIKIVLASGRSYELMQEIGATGIIPIDAYITLNGSIILNHNLQLIQAHPMDQSLAHQMIKLAEEKKMTLHIVEQHEQYYCTAINDICKRSMERLHIIDTYEPHPYRGNTIYVMMAFAPKEILDEVEKLLPDFYYHRFEEGATDINLRGVSKGKGAQFLLSHFNLLPEEALAIGDGLNDLELLNMIPHSVAMGNGHPKVKEIAEFVTDDIAHDGFAKALRHYKVIK